MKDFALAAFLLGAVLSSSLVAIAENAGERLSGSDAVKTARAKLPPGNWLLGGLSNYGGAGNVQPDWGNLRVSLMDRSGRAGQWMVMFFEDHPKHTDGGYSYPFAQVRVSNGEARTDTRFPTWDRPWKLFQIQDAVPRLDSARQVAIQEMTKLGVSFDAISVRADISKTGDTSWHFRFWQAQSGKLLREVVVAGDGNKLLESHGSPFR